MWSTAKSAVIKNDYEAPQERDTTQPKQSAAQAWCKVKYNEMRGNVNPVTGYVMVDKPDRKDWFSEYSMECVDKGLSQKDITANVLPWHEERQRKLPRTKT